ncbi:hypothetical protein B0T10DRAFT_262745 [Thelonectria olida]|uniref:Uncharacterized protein n=1 Tax=Thelonectria olida TaxID=1576542 RepID=A0A9P9AP56_9HYPO|nr:hypothetical protein B0T10DRAFT_262745 [Thelonectria olida]
MWSVKSGRVGPRTKLDRYVPAYPKYRGSGGPLLALHHSTRSIPDPRRTKNAPDAPPAHQKTRLPWPWAERLLPWLLPLPVPVGNTWYCPPSFPLSKPTHLLPKTHSIPPSFTISLPSLQLSFLISILSSPLLLLLCTCALDELIITNRSLNSCLNNKQHRDTSTHTIFPPHLISRTHTLTHSHNCTATSFDCSALPFAEAHPPVLPIRDISYSSTTHSTPLHQSKQARRSASSDLETHFPAEHAVSHP